MASSYRPIEDVIRRALLLEVHETIERHAGRLTELLCGQLEEPGLSYPPGARLSSGETAAVRTLSPRADAASAIRKLAADTIGAAFFRLFAVIDAVGDPVHHEGDWLPLALAEAPEADDLPGLHADLLESYWAWRDEVKQKDRSR